MKKKKTAKRYLFKIVDENTIQRVYNENDFDFFLRNT